MQSNINYGLHNDKLTLFLQIMVMPKRDLRWVSNVPCNMMNGAGGGVVWLHRPQWTSWKGKLIQSNINYGLHNDKFTLFLQIMIMPERDLRWVSNVPCNMMNWGWTSVINSSSLVYITIR